MEFEKSARSCISTLALSTLGGRNWAYFCYTSSGFWDMDRFWKLPYLGMKPGTCNKCQKLHMDPLSTPGSKLVLFRSTGRSFRDTGRFWKFPYLGMKPGIWKKCQTHGPFFYPKGSKFRLFCSTGSGFRDTGRCWKLLYLGMKPGTWKKLKKLHMSPLSTPWDRNWTYFHSTGSGFWDMGRFENCHIWPWNLESEKSAKKLDVDPLSTAGVEIELILLYEQRYTGRFWKLPYLGMKHGIWKKVPEVAYGPS